MRFYVVLRYTVLTFPILALFLILSGGISWWEQTADTGPLFFTASLALLLTVFPMLFVPKVMNISNKEGLMIVVLSWLSACVFGAIPYIMYGGPFTLTNAFFESVSGFTTTGSTILSDIEALPHGLLFWRSATHWIGGVGIVIFTLSLLPFLGYSEVILFRSEISHLARQDFQMRARKATQILVSVYFGLTLFEIVFLMIAGMGVFDAVTHSFGTIATGGFSPRNMSVGTFHSIWIEAIIIVFMILSGIHFAVMYASITGRSFKIWMRSSVVRLYLFMILFGTILTTLNLTQHTGLSLGSAFRQASFNLISVATSTGFASADTSVWPAFSKLLLLYFALQCASAGSTSGGIKVDRVLLMLKAITRRMRQIMRPRALISIKVDGNVVDDHFANNAVLYIVVYILIVLGGTAMLSFSGVNLEEAFSGSVAAMGNVGPGLGRIGSLGNYSVLPELSKWVLAGLMMLGRLEIFALLVFLTPHQWRQSKAY
ncbi:MAG: TrkH family potassium uptake protein [Candidatus Marinimicrobia bacterium]|nr:TrkH family potassium uptake protein [Candidatus Neomarinimicrobiota bacterium]